MKTHAETEGKRKDGKSGRIGPPRRVRTETWHDDTHTNGIYVGINTVAVVKHALTLLRTFQCAATLNSDFLLENWFLQMLMEKITNALHAATHLYYNLPSLSVCRRSQTAGRNSCSIVSGDVSN